MKTIFSIFLFWFLSFSGLAQWMELDPGVDVDYFTDVFAISQNNAIVVGTNGTILKTSDAGETWEQKESGTNEILSNVQFPSPEIGYIIGGNGTFLKTIDGGENWTSIDGVCASTLSCVNENLIFVTCNGSLHKSNDGGENWVEVIEAPSVKQIQFLNDESGFAGKYHWEIENWENPQIYKLGQDAFSWESIQGVAPFHFFDENTGYYYLNGLHKTTDGGNTYEDLTYQDWEDLGLNSISVINQNIVWGIIFYERLDMDTSSHGIIKISSTDSENFEEIILWDNDPELNLRSIHFANETIGYAVGNNGDLYNNGHGIIWKNGNGLNEPMGTEEQNNLDFKVYPNPASSELNITLTNSNMKFIKVDISDLSGKIVYSNEFSNPKNIKIDVKSFAKGTYILTLNHQAQKIIIK